MFFGLDLFFTVLQMVAIGNLTKQFLPIFLGIFLASVSGYAQNSVQHLKQADSVYAMNNYTAAHKSYLKALSQAEKEYNNRVVMLSLRGIGVCDYYLYDKKAALDWFYRYLNKIKEQKADSLLYDANYLIGVLYIENGVTDSVNKYTFAAIELMKKERRYGRLSQAYATLTEFHIQTTKRNDDIKKYLQLAEKYALMAHDSSMLAFVKMKEFNYHFYFTKNYQAALPSITQAEYIYEKTGNTEATTNAYRAKAECLAMLGDTLAGAYMNKWFNFKDSVFDVEKAQGIAKYETLYETEKKETKLLLQQQQLEKERQVKRLYLFIGAFLLSGVLLAGYIFVQRNKHEKQRLLEEQHQQRINEIFNAEQQERIRIARDLHDSIGQKLAVMKMLLPQITPDHTKVLSYLDETATEVRTISHNLIPEILNFGLPKALKSLADQLNSTQKISVNFTYEENEYREPEKSTSLTIYRIIQELLSNTVKHAGSEHIDMELMCSEGVLYITINDNGKGIHAKAIENANGIGWKNIYTRIKLIGGRIKINSHENKGSVFCLEIPI